MTILRIGNFWWMIGNYLVILETSKNGKETNVFFLSFLHELYLQDHQIVVGEWKHPQMIQPNTFESYYRIQMSLFSNSQ